MQSVQDPFVVVGRVTAAFGVLGWVKVLSYTRPPDNLLSYQPWCLKRDGAWLPWALDGVRLQGGTILAKPSAVTERNGASALVGSEIAVSRDVLPATDPGEYYWSDLIGLDVYTLQGIHLGRIERMIETGAHDVMQVAGERERLIPFVRGVHVRDVDLAAGRVEVDWDPEY